MLTSIGCEVTSESFKIDIAQVLFKKYNLQQRPHIYFLHFLTTTLFTQLYFTRMLKTLV